VHETPTYRLIDLFAGCGGMTLGFVQSSRFEPVFAVEMDRHAARTYEANFGGAHIVEGRIEDVLTLPPAEVVIGGPPCQGFSNLNMTRTGLERRRLWEEYLRVIEQSAPLAFVMENVPALLKAPEYREFVVEVSRLGYEVTADVLNAADFGVPQIRKRAFVVGSLMAKPTMPAPTHRDPERALRLDEDERALWETVRDALTGPPALAVEPDGANWHRRRNPTELSLARYRAIPEEGMNWRDLVDRAHDLCPPCWLNKTSGSTDVFGRLWWDRPALTIRTEFQKPEKGRYLHPEADRAITVREAARLQSFPDHFVFPEDQSMTAVARQIGNAVPPLLARRLAEAVATHLDAHVLGLEAA
jgi:DNA (cytosine-5)-methyltransferase 1